jgi:CheY-like chemotaxis protein
MSTSRRREDPDLSKAPPIPRDAKYILVLDDEPMVREIICEFLKSSGYGIVPAGTDDEAMAALNERGVPDLMILDYALAGIDGIKVYRKLTAAAGRIIPTILITGMISDGVAAEASGLGVTFLNKPMKLEYLARIVERRLAEAAGGQTDR